LQAGILHEIDEKAFVVLWLGCGRLLAGRYPSYFALRAVSFQIAAAVNVDAIVIFEFADA